MIGRPRSRSVVHFWRDLPFARKLALLLIALVSVPLVIVVLYTSETNRSALIASAKARDLGRARATADAVEAFLADKRADVRTTAALQEVLALCGARGRDRRAGATQSLHAMRREQEFLALYVTDRSGRVLAATDERVTVGRYATGQAFLSAVAGETSVDEPIYDGYDDTVTLRVSTAVRSEAGEIIGTVTGIVDIASLDRLIERDTNYRGHGEFGVLWSGAGLRLSDPANPTLRFAPLAPVPSDTLVVTQQRLGPAFPEQTFEGSALASVVERGAWLLYDPGTEPHVRAESSDLGPLQATIAPLARQRWLYAVFVPESSLLAAMRAEALRDWAVAFFSVLAALVLSVVAAGWVTRPLRRITEAAHALARGEMSRRVGLVQGDELGQVAAAFDAMVDALGAKELQLQGHAAELEHRVEERTRVLQVLEQGSRAMAASLELERTASSLASLLVPAFADFCQLDVCDSSGLLRRVGCRHFDPRLDRVASAMPDARPAPALADENGDACSDIPVVTLGPGARHALGLGSVRVYPLGAGRQVVGYLTTAMTTGGRTFDGASGPLFEELGRRAGLAVANARLYRDAQDANRLKDEFLGLVSHELRTPLNAIMGWTRLAAMTDESGVERERALAAVQRNARALARLVDDLLDVPRIITGKLALDRRPVDLVSVIHAAVDGIRPAAFAKAVTVQVVSELPSATLQGDPHRLQQVLSNLLSNAVKFTPADGRVTVRVARRDESFVVTVHDTGIGIDPEFLPFVFERFKQADSSTTRAYGGLGIGLSIAHHLVERHGGRVTAASDGPGRGSTFTVVLPALAEPSVTADFGEPDPEGADAGARSLQGLAVLVLDDEAESREVIATLLASVGARVTLASTVGAALSGLGRAGSLLDAVVADIGMPGEDGYAFIAALRTSPDAAVRTLPVVALTAYASTADRSRALAAGFDVHLAKPVTLGRLVSAVAEVSGSRARSRAAGVRDS